MTRDVNEQTKARANVPCGALTGQRKASVATAVFRDVTSLRAALAELVSLGYSRDRLLLDCQHRAWPFHSDMVLKSTTPMGCGEAPADVGSHIIPLLRNYLTWLSNGLRESYTTALKNGCAVLLVQVDESRSGVSEQAVLLAHSRDAVCIHDVSIDAEP